MAYRLKQGRSIESELRRIANRQLQLAIAEMRDVGDRKSDEALHEARRHVKKIRALIRLVQPALGTAYRAANKRLRIVNRLLAPVADGEAVVETLGRLGQRYRGELPRRTLVSIRKALVQRWARVDRQAKADHVLRNVATLLREEQRHVQSWHLKRRGSRAVAPGLRKTMRGARGAMALAIDHPTNDHYHSWRRRVKDCWFQVRLLEGRCGDELIAHERSLEALDGCLGEYHNCVLLAQVLITDALVPRDEIALSLRLLGRYQRELRREAHSLGAQVNRETPRQFVRLTKGLWRSAAAQGSTPDMRPSWPQAA
jgi:CHAD domain-containing protein